MLITAQSTFVKIHYCTLLINIINNIHAEILLNKIDDLLLLSNV